MPWRSRLMASTRSSRSVVKRGVLGLDLAQLFLGAQIDRAQPLAVAAQLFEVFLDLGERRQFRARLDLGQCRHARAARLRACRGFRARCRRGGAWCLPCALRRGRRPRGRWTALPAKSWRRGRFPPSRSRRRPARRRRRGGRFRRYSISLISARRFSANIAGALSSSARSAVTSVMRASMVAICEAALCLRFCHSLRSARIACTRRSASSASRASACASARTCAARRRWPSMSVRTAASLVSVSRLGGNSASAAVALSCAASASLRSAARRLWASVSADLRAAWRLISRSVRGMAFARGIGLALRGAPGFAGGGLRSSTPPSARSRRLPAPAAWRRHRCGPAPVRVRCRPGARVRRDAARRRSGHGLRRQNRPSARRRLPATPAAGRSSIATPVPRRAPWRRRRSAPDGAPVRTAPRRGRRAHSTPSGSAGSSPVAPALVQRIGADGSTGASRSSPSAAPSAFS